MKIHKFLFDLLYRQILRYGALTKKSQQLVWTFGYNKIEGKTIEYLIKHHLKKTKIFLMRTLFLFLFFCYYLYPLFLIPKYFYKNTLPTKSKF